MSAKPSQKRSRSVDLKQWSGNASSTPSLGRNVQKRATLSDISRLASAGLVRSPAQPQHLAASLRLPTPEELAQERAFRKFFNARLESAGFEPMANLATDLCSDGVTLLRLLEILSGEPLPMRWNHNPKMRVQRAENLDIALRWIRDTRGIRITNVGAEDLLDGNLKLILGITWTLLFRLSFSNLAADGSGAKDSLLTWVQQICAEAPYELDVDDWHWSWQDGRALCALLHSQKQSTFEWGQVERLNDEQRINFAFDASEQVFKVPRSLEVHDLCKSMRHSRPDEKLVICYVAGLYEAFKAAHVAESSTNRLVAFAEQLDLILSAQDQYMSRAKDLVKVLSDVRGLWRRERTPKSYEEALQKLESMAEPASRNRLRAERRELSSIYVRVVSMRQTNGMAAWKLPKELLSSTLNADIALFLQEEDARRHVFSEHILKVQNEAKEALTVASNVAAQAVDHLINRLDATGLAVEVCCLPMRTDQVLKRAQHLKTCQDELVLVTKAIEQLSAAESEAERVDAVALHARLHTSDDLALERDKLAATIKERLLLHQSQQSRSQGLTVVERDRAATCWRRLAESTHDCLGEEDFAALVALPELALSAEEGESAYAELAGSDGMTYEAFLVLLQRQKEQGEASIRRAFAAFVGGDGSLDLSSLPPKTAKQLAKHVAGEVDALLARLYS